MGKTVPLPRTLRPAVAVVRHLFSNSQINIRLILIYKNKKFRRMAWVGQNPSPIWPMHVLIHACWIKPSKSDHTAIRPNMTLLHEVLGLFHASLVT